ncbi:MAG: DUF1801 domain-containing protein [Deltaproteobacteria bacterium]|nr:DUF1801 domain-containing protein [Deltaproteobacteria bacterium]
MASSAAATVDAYLAELPEDRRAALTAVRAVVNAHLPAGYVEGMQYGMIGWCVPLSRYPDTYNGQPLAIASLASQKQYMALYLVGVYGDRDLEAWFRRAFAASGKKLDMGKSCVRFKTLDALPLDVIGQTIAKVPVDAFLARYEAVKKPASARTVRSTPSPSSSPSPSPTKAKRTTKAKQTAKTAKTAKVRKVRKVRKGKATKPKKVGKATRVGKTTKTTKTTKTAKTTR